MSNQMRQRGPERRQFDRRNNRPYDRRSVSYAKPFVFYFLELGLLFPALGIAELTFDPTKWSPVSYGVCVVWALYATRKLLRVLARQGRR